MVRISVLLNHVSEALLSLVNFGLKNEAWNEGWESLKFSPVFHQEPICFQSLKQGFFSFLFT